MRRRRWAPETPAHRGAARRLLVARKLLAKWHRQDTAEDPSPDDEGLASYGVIRDTVADPLRPADEGTAAPPGQPAGSFTIYSLPRVFGD